MADHSSLGRHVQKRAVERVKVPEEAALWRAARPEDLPVRHIRDGILQE